MLVVLAVLLLVVWVLSVSPVWLCLALIGAFFPNPKASQTLLEVEASAGAAYTTALTAPEDQHGFKQRLESMALAAQKTAELPPLPVLEVLGMAILLSLLLVLPPRVENNALTDDSQTVSRESLVRDNPTASNANNAEPVIDAPSRDAPPAGADASPGQAASGGSLAEENLGKLKPGGGSATEDPQALSREFMEALERGAIRDRDSNTANDKIDKIEDANPPQAAQSGSLKGSQDGQNSGANGQGRENQNQGNNQNGQGNGQNNEQNGQNSQPNSAQGQDGNGQSGQNGSSTQGQAGATQNDNGSQNNANRDPRGNNLDRGENYEGFDPRNAGSNNPNRTATPGKGANRAAGDGVAANRKDGQGKLEYLQGAPKGNQVRSGALQLPGDPKNGFTSPQNSAAYRRAAESAVLDPRLPPEYQELLRNYYR
ncbi:MAG: hypothetical protein ACK41E_03130 [Deinococcales bacterium]